MMISTNGITLHATESGAGDLALVYLHYWGGTARTWAPVIAALPQTSRHVALDARGWGGSGRPADGHDITTMADDAAGAIAALGLRRYVLVGHSMGGKVAQLLASRRPAGLAGLVLVAPSPAQGKSLPAEMQQAMAGAYATEQAAAWTLGNVLAGRPLPPALRAQVLEDSVSGSDAAKSAWPLHAISEDVSADLARIDVPVLVIGGEADKVDGVDMLRDLVLPALPGATPAVIPGAGHLLPLEAPEGLAALIGQFCARLGTAAARPEDIPPAFDAALNRGDLDALMALFHPDAVMRMTDGSTAENPAALRQSLDALRAMRPELHNTIRRVLTSGDIALLLLEWTIRFTPPDGTDILQHGTATQMAQRNAGGVWQLRIANPLGIA